MAVRLIRANERCHHRTPWLSTSWHFSFDGYHDRANVSLGALRVFRDDTVAPRIGFPLHAHADIGILSGRLEHRDSEGDRGEIRQATSAGAGITDAEHSPCPTEPVHSGSGLAGAGGHRAGSRGPWRAPTALAACCR